MELNTLLYFFSTVAQVLAAISALLAIFTQFRINEITNFLIGDGNATYVRLKDKEPGYDILGGDHEKLLSRLRDSISRKSILGILEVITILAEKQIKTGPRDLNYLEKRFKERKQLIETLKTLTKRSILFAFITILISLIGIIFVGILNDYIFLYSLFIGITLILTICTMVLTLKGIYNVLNDMEDV